MRDNIKIDLKEAGWECVNWIHLLQDNDTEYVYSGSTKCWKFLEEIRDY
jgi:hypothetical protein